MTSKKQKQAGWQLPESLIDHDLIDVCLKIPNEQKYRQAFLGAIWSLGKWWNWEKSYIIGDERAKTASEYWRSILHNHLNIGCDDVGYFELRQNPLDECEIQQRISSDGDWFTAYRTDVCVEPTNATDVIIFQQNETIVKNEITNRYDGSDITTINANLTITTYDDSGDPERDAALCMAVDSYVKSFVAKWVQQAQIILGLGVAAIIIIGSVPFLGWIAGLTLGAATGLVAAASLNAAQQEDAITDVICCMLDGLRGETINTTTFEDSLDGCSFMVGSDAEYVREIVAAGLTSEDNWIVFLDGLGRAFDLAQAGVDECPCNNVIKRLGGYLNDDLTSLSLGGAPAADYNGTQDWYEGGLAGTTPNNARLFDIRLAVDSAWEITRIVMKTAAHRTRSSGGTNLQIIAYNGTDRASTSISVTANPQVVETEFTGSLTGASEIRFYAGVNTLAPNNGQISLASIRVEYNP